MVANELLLDITNCTIAELVQEAQAGNQEAQGALYERYQDSCIALACRLLGNRDEAEELVQDVFIHAFARLDQLRVPEAFGVGCDKSFDGWPTIGQLVGMQPTRQRMSCWNWFMRPT